MKKKFAKNKVWWLVLGLLLVNVFLGLKIFGVFEKRIEGELKRTVMSKE